MKYEDTVMSDKEIKKNLAFVGVLTDARLIARAQAEISFEMGYKQALLDNHLPVEYNENKEGKV